MAFSLNDRVRVTDQSSNYRKHLGTVKEVDLAPTPNQYQVRLDGHAEHGRILFLEPQLGETTLASPLAYSES